MSSTPIILKKDWVKLFRHPFHLVSPSAFPVVTGWSSMLVVMNIVFYWQTSINSFVSAIDSIIFQISVFFLISVIFSWFISVVIESKDFHSVRVAQGLRYGMILFITSEVLFFFAFFWGFFHLSLVPSVMIGSVWPAPGTEVLDVFGLPLVNTLLLLSSGYALSIAHHAILSSDEHNQYTKFLQYLLVSVILGVTFLICQGLEYKYGLSFSWKDGIFGSVFFLTTGFHGFHVIVGTIFLIFCLVRGLITGVPNLITPLAYPWNSLISEKTWQKLINFRLYSYRYGFSPSHHIGFEAAAWYWHFVDVVWLFLYVSIYLWGSSIPK